MEADVVVVGLGRGRGRDDPHTMFYGYPTFHRAVDSALWPPTKAARMAGA